MLLCPVSSELPFEDLLIVQSPEAFFQFNPPSGIPDLKFELQSQEVDVIYKINAHGVRDRNGMPLDHSALFYTVNRLPEGPAPSKHVAIGNNTYKSFVFDDWNVTNLLISHQSNDG